MLTTPPSAELQYIAETARATWPSGVVGVTVWIILRQLRDGTVTT
jgi:hypothetical protein